MNKVLYMLIGPKGSGKTYIGTLVNQQSPIRFIRVEPIWLGLQPGEDGWKVVEATIDALFQTHDQLMIESLGAGEGFRSFHAALVRKYLVKMIRVTADLDTCFQRVKSRSNLEHIPVSDDKVLAYNKIAATVHYDWALEIDNNVPKSAAEILAAIQTVR